MRIVVRLAAVMLAGSALFTLYAFMVGEPRARKVSP